MEKTPRFVSQVDLIFIENKEAELSSFFYKNYVIPLYNVPLMSKHGPYCSAFDEVDYNIFYLGHLFGCTTVVL